MHAMLATWPIKCYSSSHCVGGRAEQLIDLINNQNYWEMIDVQTIIVMSIIRMMYKKSHQKLHIAGSFDAKCNI